MKLYLTEILKEANAFGFGAPGQGGNSGDVALSTTSPGPSMQPQSPAMQAQPQAGGMMLPNIGMGGPSMGMNGQLQLGNPSFKPMI